MRSAIGSALLVAAATACGNLSNEDIAFAEALPQRETLRVKVPGQTAQALGLYGQADVFLAAQRIGGQVNAGLDGVLAMVDVVRGATPTTRSVDQRTWGPFPDRDHPGVSIRVVMVRELDAKGNVFRYRYSFNASRPPGGELPILSGDFYGAQATNGAGTLVIHFESSQSMGIAKPTDPKEAMVINYDFTGDPRRLDLDLGTTANGGFGLSAFNYAYREYAAGHGRFDFGFPDGKGNFFVAQTSFLASGAGKALITVTHPPFFEDRIVECWDDTASLTYLNDPAALVGQCSGVVAPCVLGLVGACPAL
jgi:hypothetical protein